MTDELNALVGTQIIYVNAATKDDVSVYTPDQAVYMEGVSDQVSVILAGPQGPPGLPPITISSTPPSSPSVGDIWIDTT